MSIFQILNKRVDSTRVKDVSGTVSEAVAMTGVGHPFRRSKIDDHHTEYREVVCACICIANISRISKEAPTAFAHFCENRSKV
jgi:hypothetical protein